MMNLYDENVQLLNVDCIELMADLKDKSIILIDGL